MVPWIARRLICPLHEAILGRRTFRFLKELERSQWWSPADLKLLQARKLRRLLKHAHDRTPWYRRRLRDAGWGFSRFDPFDVLEHMAPVTKDDVGSNLEKMVWRDVPGGLTPGHTGGSTGATLKFYLDRRRQAFDQAARARTHRWFGVNVGDHEVFLWGSPIESARRDGIKRLRDRVFNHHLLSAFEMSPSRMDAYLDELHRLRPACIFGYPSSIALLADHAVRRGRSLMNESLRAVFVTGEVCYPHDHASIGEFFRVPVVDGYGSREAGFIAHECPEGRMHITAENLIVEILSGDQAAPEGQEGEIVVTHLDGYGMPLIRYRTGDCGRLRSGRCACGRGLPLMDVVQGRATDFLVLPDGTIRHALSIIYPLRAMSGVRAFRVEQREDYGITVSVVRDDRKERITREAVAGRVRPVIGDGVDLTVSMVDRIAPTSSGKYRYVVSHAALRVLAGSTGGDRID